MKSSAEHYEKLFRQLVRKHGDVHDETSTGIVGFQFGGPVSIREVGNGNGFVTVELSLYKEQQASSEGIRFELFTRAGLGKELTQSMLTALGNLSMNATLGAGHTIDMRQVLESSEVKQVRLDLHSRVGWLWPRYGIYEVVPV